MATKKIRILSQIDRGGLGQVNKAEIIGDNSYIAIKRLIIPFSHEDARRFEREVRMMKKLNHENIMPIIGYDLDADPPYYLMPLAKYNLTQILPYIRENPILRKEVIDQILSGLAYAHFNEVLHRDLKPENILILNDDRVVISDFGLGCLINRDTTILTRAGGQYGTHHYIAPEQEEDFTKSDNRSDIYSLGKVLYQMFTTRPYYPIADVSGIDNKYAYIIQKCFRNDPNKRYQSVNDLVEDFFAVERDDYINASPTEQAKKIIVEITDDDFVNRNSRKVESLLRIFLENREVISLFKSILLEIRDELLKYIIDNYSESFSDIFKTFDELASGRQNFEFCDTIADFYNKVFLYTADFEIKELIIVRLLLLGFNHNRWYVRDVLAVILYSINDIGNARLAISQLRAYPNETNWASNAINFDKLHQSLREGIREIINIDIPDDEMEFPF